MKAAGQAVASGTLLSGHPKHPGMQTDPQAQVISDATAGRPGAARALVETHHRAVYRLVWRMLGKRATVAITEELVQETFVRVFRALPRYRADGPAKFTTWLLSIATHTAIDELRKRRVELTPLHETRSAAATDGPEQHVARKQVAEAIADAVEDLGPGPRAAFVLRAYHGLTYPEIAEALDVDVGTVKSRIHRARRALRSALGEMHHE